MRAVFLVLIVAGGLGLLYASPVTGRQTASVMSHGPTFGFWREVGRTLAEIHAVIGYDQRGAGPGVPAPMPASGLAGGRRMLPGVASPGGYVPPRIVADPRGATTAPRSPDAMTIPPALARFVNPALLTTDAQGQPELTPAAKEVLRRMPRARQVDPSVARDQLESVARALKSP
jgi:hypothetical protein